MTVQLAAVLGVLGMCVVMFILNKPRTDLVALLALVILPLTGVVTVTEALAGFSDPNIVLIAALFVVGDGLVRTGVANQISAFLLRRAAGNENRLLVLLMLAVAGLGAVMSSTGVVAIFIPVVSLIAIEKKLSPGRLMMPLSFAGLISGMLTLVGTAPNLVASSALENAGLAGFRFFSFTPFGLTILAAGIAYMLYARRWLDRGGPPDAPAGTRRRLTDFVRDYELAAREYRVRIKPHSPLAGMTVEAANTRRTSTASIVAIERQNGLWPTLLEPRAETQLQAGDVLLLDFVDPKTDQHQQRLAEAGLEPLPLTGSYFTDQARELGMAEVLLPPDSALVGRTVAETSFRRKHRLSAIGLRRKGKALPGGIANETLQPGDVLLVIGRWKFIRELQTQRHDFLVLNLPAELDQVAPASHRAPYALATLALMIVLMVTGWIPNVLAALVAGLLMGAGGCVTLNSAYRSIHWPSLFVIVGMMPFSTALQKTGGIDLAVNGLVSIFGQAEPRLLLAALFAFTAIVGLFVSNTATAVLMAPIAVQLAAAFNASPYPFVMTVALAASAAFMTPVSSPVNTLVLAPGKYRFGDFVRVGVPFTFITLLITVVLVPWLLPLKQ